MKPSNDRAFECTACSCAWSVQNAIRDGVQGKNCGRQSDRSGRKSLASGWVEIQPTRIPQLSILVGCEGRIAGFGGEPVLRKPILGIALKVGMDIVTIEPRL